MGIVSNMYGKQVEDVQTKCTVNLDGLVETSDDFVSVLSKPDGSTVILYNTDALTLGMAVKLVSAAFVKCAAACTPDERAELTAFLGEAFTCENPEVPTCDK